MDPVVHFEMPYDDGKRMAKFYETAFGWQTRALDEDMGNYVLATSTETDERGPRQPGAINGGFYSRNPAWPAQHPSVVIAVADIGESVMKVSAAGGTVIGEPVEIPGVGHYVSFFDTEGNRVSMLQPVPRNWHAPTAGSGGMRPGEPSSDSDVENARPAPTSLRKRRQRRPIREETEP